MPVRAALPAANGAARVSVYTAVRVAVPRHVGTIADAGIAVTGQRAASRCLTSIGGAGRLAAGIRATNRTRHSPVLLGYVPAVGTGEEKAMRTTRLRSLIGAATGAVLLLLGTGLATQ